MRQRNGNISQEYNMGYETERYGCVCGGFGAETGGEHTTEGAKGIISVWQMAE